MEDNEGPSIEQRIAKLRKRFQARRVHGLPRWLESPDGGVELQPLALADDPLEAWSNTEWPQTEWPDTVSDPQAGDAQ